MKLRGERTSVHLLRRCVMPPYVGGSESLPRFKPIAINLPVVFAEIVNFATDNNFHSFASPPLLDEILDTHLMIEA